MGILRRISAFALIALTLTACQNSSDPTTSTEWLPLPEGAEDEILENPFFSQSSGNIGHNCPASVARAGRYELPLLYDPCSENMDNRLVYNHLGRTLYVCENGKTIWANFVAGGKKGFGKRRQGDQKVPNGIYTLGKPRPSGNFGIFIPIDYPNAEDRKAGLTGGSIGIHGPVRKFACDANNSPTPWTNGCLAYPTDRHVYELALWIRKNPDAYIELREK